MPLNDHPVTDEPGLKAVFKKNFTGANNEIEEIISNRLPFMVRRGTLFFFFMLLVLTVICWFIKYPDVITARGVLNSINSPKEVQTRVSGKLVKLIVKENQPVNKEDILGYIESTAKHEEIIQLSEMLDSISLKMENGNTNNIIPYQSRLFTQLGEIQTSYQTFSSSFSVFINYLSNGFSLRKKNMLSADIGYLTRLHSQLLYQRQLLVKDLSLADSTFTANEELKTGNVISALDYRNEKSKLIAKQMTLPQVNSSIITNESQQHEKQKEIAELENQIQQQKNIFLLALNTFKSQVSDWEKKYLLKAPVEGKVSFAGFIQENQELKTGQLICYVNPGNTDYYAEALISQYSFGKIKKGQAVLIKLQAYPYHEFGYLKGKIETVTAIPTDSGYLAKVSLPKTLLTNYNKPVQYRTGLLFQGEIITEELNLLQRLFYNLRKRVN